MMIDFVSGFKIDFEYSDDQPERVPSIDPHNSKLAPEKQSLRQPSSSKDRLS